MRKIIPYIIILTIFIGVLAPKASVRAFPCTSQDVNGKYFPDGCDVANAPTGTGYQLLAPLPCPPGVTDGCTGDKLTSFDPSEEDGNGRNIALGKYLNIMIRIIIGIAAVLAMVMIVIGGIEYMTTELISSKEEGKKRITNAVFGLILALSAYLILNQINPDLLRTDLSVTQANLTYFLGGESPDPFVSINQSTLQSAGITSCTGSGGSAAIMTIGQQFIGKTVYSQAAGKRNTVNGSTITLDCSAFVSQVYVCAGLGNPGGNTNGIFSSGANSIDGSTFDFTTLRPGDLIGWMPKDDKNGNGHVAIYAGNGQILDTQPSGTQIRSLDSIKSRVKYTKSPGGGGGSSF